MRWNMLLTWPKEFKTISIYNGNQLWSFLYYNNWAWWYVYNRYTSCRINIMDNIMSMMEKYAYNLEEIVEERTQQLVEEKKKTDRLLYRMLPSYVRDCLLKFVDVIKITWSIMGSWSSYTWSCSVLGHAMTKNRTRSRVWRPRPLLSFGWKVDNVFEFFIC